MKMGSPYDVEQQRLRTETAVIAAVIDIVQSLTEQEASHEQLDDCLVLLQKTKAILDGAVFFPALLLDDVLHDAKGDA